MIDFNDSKCIRFGRASEKFVNLMQGPPGKTALYAEENAFPKVHEKVGEKKKILKHGKNQWKWAGMYYSGVFEVAEHEYRIATSLRGTWCPGRPLLLGFYADFDRNQLKIVTRGFSRSLNSNIVSPSAPEVPGAQGDLFSWNSMLILIETNWK